MKFSNILKTFAKHEPALREFFRGNKRTPDCHYSPSELTEYEYLLVLTELLSETQQREMYLKIRKEFADPAEMNHITANVCFISIENHHLIE